MYIVVNDFCGFANEFEAFCRDTNFSYEGLKALYEHLEQCEEDSGISIELDVIALCCEYREINSDEEEFKEYHAGSDREEFVIAYLEHSVLVMEG